MFRPLPFCFNPQNGYLWSINETDMNDNRITDRLFALRDEDYRAFHSKLVPTVDPERIIGVRTPDLRRLARELARDAETADRFLAVLPHRYFEENSLHGALLSLRMKEIGRLLTEIDRFLPYVDNWATCDMLSPKLFARHPGEVEAKVAEWLGSGRTYTVRFGVVTLLQFFLDGHFRPGHFEWLCALPADEYYVNMAVAWYFSFALVKQWDAALPVIESNRLERWIHNKAIQKAVESLRIPPERKEYLRRLKRR